MSKLSLVLLLATLLSLVLGDSAHDSWKSDLLLQGTVTSTIPPIQYWRSGFSVNPHGDIIIFSPGAGLDHHIFDAQVLPLVLSGHRVITYDPRCQGLSQVSDPTLRANCVINFDLMLQDMLAIFK
jgi:pimeloyl-ACP methyl ester carboxylesterase